MEERWKGVDERFEKEYGGRISKRLKDFIHKEIEAAEGKARVEFVRYIFDNIAERAEFDLDWEEVKSCLEYGLSEIKIEVANEKH